MKKIDKIFRDPEMSAIKDLADKVDELVDAFNSLMPERLNIGEWTPEHPEGVNKEIVPCWGQTHLKMINRAHERIDEMKKTKRKRSAEKSCKKVRK